MRNILHLVAFFLCLVITRSSETDSDVIELNASSFAGAIEENPLIAIEFFSPWCGHCKSLAPEWEKAATELKGKVPIAKVDCTENQELCGEQGIQGYPTLKLFREGESSIMETARTSEAIINFLTKELEPPVQLLTSEANLEDFVKQHPIAALAYLDNDHDDRWNIFKTVALQKRHSLSFAAVLHSDWAPHSSPALMLYRNFDDPKLVYDGEFTAPALTSWIAQSLLPILGEINVETFSSYMAANLKMLGYLFVDPNDANTATLLKELEPKLLPYKDDFRVAWINNNKYAQQAQRLGLSSKVPSLALDNQEEGVRYVFPEDKTVTVESLAEWFAQYKAGTLAPFVKSEPVPESNDEPVKVIVAHTFKDIAYDADKDVLVEFYAPWCGHCKNLAPVWTRLGEVFQSIPSVVISKIDSTANDVPPKLNIRGFPTILLFPSTRKDTPVEYQGSRSLEDLVKFVHTNADVKFALPTIDSGDQEDTNRQEKDEL